MAQRNHPGLGTEYEVLVPAYFCLKLMESEEVEDFDLLSNAEGFGNVDDLILHIKRRGQSELYFALQLKHADADNARLYPNTFWTADDNNNTTFKGDFKLGKYCKTYSEFDDAKQKYHIIVFTNRTFDPAKATEVLNFTMQQDDNCEGRIYFDTSNAKSIYKFTLNDTSEFPPKLSQNQFQKFFEKLSVYTSQCNSKNVERKIKDIFSNNYCVNESSATDFINFFRSWHKNEFRHKKLTKKDVQIQLIQILLKKCTKRGFSIVKPGGDCRKNDVLKRVVNSFDITLLRTLDILKEDKNNGFVGDAEILLNDAKENKIAKRDAENLTPEEHYSTLICTGRSPVVAKYKNSTKKSISLVLNNILLRNKDIPMKMIICGENIDLNELSSFSVFNNLEDVRLKNENLFVEVLKNFRISLQGRGEILMNQIIDEKASQFITAEDLIKSSNDELTIGSKCETVIEHYVPRILETICIPFECTIQIKEDLMVISCGNEFEKVERRLRRNTQKKVFKIGAFLDKVKSASSSQEFSEEYKSAIVLTQSEVEMELFSTFPGSIHFLKAVDENSFQWIMTRGDIKNLRNISKSRMIKGVLEEDIFNIFKNNNVNVVCAEPGMGKSVLMEVSKKYSPRDHWAVKIDFRECSQIFKAFDKDHQWEDLFYKKIFEKDESVRMKVEEILLKRKKIYLFFDGLDELQSSYIETAIKFIQTLISSGFKIWVSSRRNLQDLLETRLNVFALNIQGFSEETERNYIKNRLSPFYESEEIEAITEKIFENAKVFNNCEILGIPLQLSMLTEILIQDRDLGREFNEKIFVMTEMFESFFEGKITHYLKKITSNPEMLLEDYKKFYSYFEIAALKSCLDESFYESLKIAESSEYREFIKTDPSRLGIITKITEDGVPVFQHNTYGEYFVACYFTKYYENISLERLFESQYSNIRLMFDIKLAEDSLPHLAVIYKDFDRLATFEDDITGVDKGGRNLLHLASCYYGVRFPFVDVEKAVIEWDIYEILPNKNRELSNVKIIKLFQSKKISAFDRDEVFKWNCLQYCDAVFNLEIINVLLTDKSIDLFEFVKNLEKCLANYQSVFFYASKFNFKNIFITLKRLFVASSKIDSFESVLKIKTLHGDTILHVAALNGSVDMVELLLNEGVDVNAKNEEEETALHLAVFPDRLTVIIMFFEQRQFDIDTRKEYDDTTELVDDASRKILQQLLEKGADLTAINKFGETVLHVSAYSKEVRWCKLVFKLFSQRNIDVNVKNSKGQTALHIAVGKDNLESVRFLVSQEEIDFESRDDKGNTPLHLAGTFASLDIFALLLERGADLKAINNLGNTVLHISVFRKRVRSCELVFKLFSERNIDVNVKNSKGQSVLHVAVGEDNLEIVRFLVSQEEIDFESRDDQGYTPLHFAAGLASLEMFELLLERGADVKVINNLGDTVLHLSAWNKKVRCCELIFKLFSERSIDVNVKNSKGQSVLHTAVRNDNLEVVKFLLSHKEIDIESRSDQESTPLHFAAGLASLEMFELLLERGADLKAIDNFGNTVLHRSAFRKDARCCGLAFKLFSERDIDVNVKNSEGQSALHVAVAEDNLEIVRYLLSHEEIDFECKEEDGYTPLHYAAAFASLDSFELLLERGADLKAINNNGDTVLHLLAMHKMSDAFKKLANEKSALHEAIKQLVTVVKLLLTRLEIDLECKNKIGNTPLLVAAGSSYVEIFELLVKTGANLTAINNCGETVLHISAKHGNNGVMNFILGLEFNGNAVDNNGNTYLYYAETHQ